MFSVRPRLAEPGSSNDFFRNEYVQLWGEFAVSIDLTYYRDDQIASRRYAVESDDLAMVYELIVPLQRRETLDAERVEHYRKLIREGHRPTAIALGILDDRLPIAHSFIAHEHLLNFLIDGHHKMRAAHLEEAEITLLSCITTYQLSSDTALKNLIDAYKEAAASQETRATHGLLSEEELDEVHFQPKKGWHSESVDSSLRCGASVPPSERLGQSIRDHGISVLHAYYGTYNTAS